ncbi:acriflavin resistance protein [Solemya pervernicosa gill symbiont]|uniref:Acriflavin resistance protein n=2 Tax=Gammaproteobacteria incertae sedis TaxID=118884 RepID=A0A1T2L3T3_9GAMM|nr:efflux RND transporter permease subunit [Candidatus Reidiella endopervernicosa]OOZ39765.1 acriflavin resistance protein [Solemya pervernicosa gill symbiont]QKQ27920.1 efflux RND transporter permease subunit [Candidatus Reidiella endopervernicosa]
MIRYFANHPTAANLMMLILLVMGIIALPEMKRETFPEFTARSVQITTAYPGASAEEIEEGICRKLEDAFDGMNNIDELRCEAREGIAIAVADMREGEDAKSFLDDLKSAVDEIDSFPELVETPTVSELNRTDQVVSIAITGPMQPNHLKAYCEGVKQRLLSHGGIPQIEINGFSDHQISIEIPTATLRQYGLSAASIANTIRNQNIDTPIGTLMGDEQELLLRFSEQRRTPEEYAELRVIAGNSGAELRLGDIATITDTFADDNNQIAFNGNRACLLSITKSRSQDTLTVYDAVERALEKERATKPATVEFHLTQDMSSVVRERLSLLVSNGIQGLVLVAATLWLFFGARFSFWVAMGLPVSFLAAFFFMQAFGLSINMISMVALLVALGLLMDDAIVLAENIAAHRARGKSPLQAAIDGTKQVAPGVFSSFLTSISVFGPLAFLSGQMGAVLKVIPMVLIITLAVSLIEAFLILPSHLNHSLSHHDPSESPMRRRFERWLAHVREDWVGALVDRAIAWRYFTLGLVVALFLITIGLTSSGILKFQGFPSIEGDQIEARILLPQGTPLDKTEAVVNEIERAALALNDSFREQQPQQVDIVENSIVRYGLNSDANESGPHLATVSLDLLSTETRNGSIPKLLNRWRELSQLPPEVINVSFKEPTRGPAGKPIEIRLQGNDLDQLKGASLELQTWLAAYRGLSDVSDDMRPGKPELRLRLKPGALNLGLDANTIATQLRAAYFGITATEIQVGIESYEVDISLSEQDRNQISDLSRFTIISATGIAVPLESVVTIEQDRGYARIQHVDGQRSVTVQANLDTRLNNSTEILSHTKKVFLPQLSQQFPQVEVVFQGESKENAKTGDSVLRAVVVGILGIFVILSFQFKSYREPLLVMAIIPMAVIGSFWGHLLMGLTLSMPSIIGLVSLSGIAVNDSILLVTFIKENIRQGMAPLEAAAQASRARFRAVLLTSATTIAGLLPILTETSMQAQILIPLVASIAFGLVATTLMVLFLVPSLYGILHDLNWTREVEPLEGKSDSEANR